MAANNLPGASSLLAGGGVKCAQINLNRSWTANVNFNEWFLEHDHKLAFIQEPYLTTKHKVSGFSNDLKILRGAAKGKVRSLVLYKKNINVWMLNQFSDPDLVTISIKLNEKIVIMASVYMPYDSAGPPPPYLVRQLVKYCQDEKHELLLACDANSQHTAWNSSKVNTRGDNLIRFILSNELFVINRGTNPTFQNTTRNEIIDLTIATRALNEKVVDWEVSKDESCSDHNIITFRVCETIDLINEDFRNIRKCDWRKYRDQLQSIGINFQGNDSIDTKAEKLERCVITAFENSCKLSKGMTGKKPPWWSKKLTELRQEVFKLKRRAARLPLEPTIECYKQAKREYKLEIESAKKNSWKKFCTGLKNVNTTARIHKVFKMGKREEIGSLKTENGYTTSPEETLKVLLDKHFPDKEEDEVVYDDIHEGNNNSNFNIDEVINLEAIIASIKSFAPYKSPGIDGIYPALLQQGIDFLAEYILEIYRDCLAQGKSPRRWLETKVVFIPKPGKSGYDAAESFRPISLFSFLLKGLERIIHWYLNKTCLIEKLHRNIFAYREGISTEDSLHGLIHKIEKALENQEQVMVLFLDLSAAFSSVTVSGIIKNLKNMGCEPEILRWCKDMLEHRIVIAFLNGGRVCKLVIRGTPQGGILSVVFWNVDSQDMQERLPEPGPTETKAFADDTATAAVGKDEHVLASHIQNSANIMVKWANDNGLKFNAGKCKVMLFSRRREPKNPKIYINNEEVQYVSEYKYLGLTIHHKMSWKSHIENITKKATNTYMQCRRMLGNTWGISPKISRWTYTALIRPILAYGCLIWIKVIKTDSQLKLLERVQRKACVATLNAMPSAPTTGLELILNLEPISIYLINQALITYMRLKENGNWKVNPYESHNKLNHFNIITKIAEEIPTISMPTDKMLNRQHIKTNFETFILTREEMNRSLKKPRPTTPNTIHIFTDGSRFNNKSGSGYLVQGHQNISFNGFHHLGELITVYQAEIHAIIEAASTLLQHQPTNQYINIFIDNQAAIMALGKYEIRNKLILECKHILNLLGERNKVRLLWIPGHSNHPGNEIADKKAKLGVEKVVFGPEPFIPVSEACIKQDIRKWCKKKHQEVWSEAVDKYKHTRLMIPAVGNKIWKQVNNLSRQNMRRATHMLTGHCTLNKHLWRMNFEQDPSCEHCPGTEETAEHFLTSCPAYATIRHHTLGNMFLSRNELQNLKINEILSFCDQTNRFDFE